MAHNIKRITKYLETKSSTELVEEIETRKYILSKLSHNLDRFIHCNIINICTMLLKRRA